MFSNACAVAGVLALWRCSMRLKVKFYFVPPKPGRLIGYWQAVLFEKIDGVYIYRSVMPVKVPDWPLLDRKQVEQVFRT